jgi:ADP-ribose pyrophosphatase
VDNYILNNKMLKTEVVQHSDSVGIIPVDEEENIFLVEQFRFAPKRSLIEIPAGTIEEDETPVEAAIREMNQEIGFRGKVTPLLEWYLAPGYDTEKMYIFSATNLKKVRYRLQMDEDETIQITKMKLKDAIFACMNGQISDCKTMAAILFLARLKNIGQ